SYAYTTIAGRENMPVDVVSFFDAMRFANWLNNGQGNVDTETGSYTLNGATDTGYHTPARNAGATIVIASEDEWFKAAYYDAASTSYFRFPTGSDTAPTCSAPTALPNSANCGDAVGDFT